MGAAERRQEIMRVLCRRRHETVKNLSFEFGVSERTILRDIEALSITEPIYTQCGRYDGCVMCGFGYINTDINHTKDLRKDVIHRIVPPEIIRVNLRDIKNRKGVLSSYKHLE